MTYSPALPDRDRVPAVVTGDLSRIREDELPATVGCHPSQAVPGSVSWRRLEPQADTEHLRWLRRP